MFVEMFLMTDARDDEFTDLDYNRENASYILQTFKISDFEIDRDSKISQRFLAACTRFQRVAGHS